LAGYNDHRVKGRASGQETEAPSGLNKQRRVVVRTAVLSLSLIVAVGSVRAGEDKIDVKNLPPAVLAAVKAKFPEAQVTAAGKEEEDHKVTYEVTLMDHGARVDVAVSAKGRIIKVEKTIDAKKLPEAVAATIKARYPDATIKRAEEVAKYEEDEDDKPGTKQKHDDEDHKPETIFEVVLASAGKSDVEVRLSPKGAILEKEGNEDDKRKSNEKDDEDDKPVKKEKSKD
jgi:hypothetical protein